MNPRSHTIGSDTVHLCVTFGLRDGRQVVAWCLDVGNRTYRKEVDLICGDAATPHRLVIENSVVYEASAPGVLVVVSVSTMEQRRGPLLLRHVFGAYHLVLEEDVAQEMLVNASYIVVSCVGECTPLTGAHSHQRGALPGEVAVTFP